MLVRRQMRAIKPPQNFFVVDAKMTPPNIHSRMTRALDDFGLILRGGFRPGPSDQVPDLPGGQPARAVVLIGNAGADMWHKFAPPTGHCPDPLNRWCIDHLTPLARRFDARVVFPFDGPPWHPFQRWAERSESLEPSPIAMLLHPQFGLWHAYRAAFLFSQELEELGFEPAAKTSLQICDNCATQPCKSTCPVHAFDDNGYDVAACREHLRRPEGADCLALGCRARRACPIGQHFTYAPAQARFHMEAFLRADSLIKNEASE